MGQRNLPYLNKLKNSIFWNSNWDNFFLYSKNLKINFFIDKFFYYIFNDKLFFSNYFISKKNNNFLNNYYFFFEINNKFKFKKLPFYSSKLWFLRFQKWILVLIFFYNINLKKKVKSTFFLKKFKFRKFFFFKKLNILKKKKFFF